jgi:N-acetylneuraminic acid mutarotase
MVPSPAPSMLLDLGNLDIGESVAAPGFILPLDERKIGGWNLFAGVKNMKIGDTDDDTAYASHAWSSSSFGYQLQLEPNTMYHVTLGFSETFGPNCELGKRIFNVAVADLEVPDLDVYASAGCRVAYDLTFPYIESDDSGNIEVLLKKGLVENPFLSVIRARESMQYSPTPQPTVAPPMQSSAPSSYYADWLTVDTGSTKPTPRHEACFVTVGDLAYLVGGRGVKPVDVYDPATQTWAMKTGPGIELHHAQCVVAGTKLYVVSAWTGNYPYESNVANIYVYDTVTDSWTTEPGLPESRRRGAAATVYHNGEIFVSHGNRGGHGQHAESLGWFDKYNITSKTWTTNLTDAPNPRDHAGGAIVDGMLCVAGGRDGGVQDFFDAAVLETDCYDFVTGQWEVRASLPQGRGGAAYGQTCDGKLMMAGGEGFDKAWRRVDVFDGTSWTTVADLKENRHGTGIAFSCQCNQAHIASGKVIQGGFEITTTETFFPFGIDTLCPASTSWPSSPPSISPSSQPSPSHANPSFAPSYSPTQTPTSDPELMVHFGGTGPADGYELASQGSIQGDYNAFFGSGITIDDTNAPNAYKSHIWFVGQNITYTLQLNAGKTFDVTLGFAESFSGNCKNDTRVFSASVGNQLEENIDVFKRVGCKKPYDLTFYDVPGGSVDVVISRGPKENPFLALIRVKEASMPTAPSPPSPATDAPTSTPSLQPVSNVPVVMVHFGSFLPAEGYDAAQQSALLPLGEVMTFNGQGVVIEGTDTPTAYASHVYTFGTNITYKLQLEEGKMYDVMLGWSESYGPNCQNNARVFDARVGTRIHDDIDVYRAVGCRKPYNVTFQDIQGGNVEVVISRGPRENPFLSLVRVSERLTQLSAVPTPPPTDLPSLPPSQLQPVKVHFGTNVASDGYDAVLRSDIKGDFNSYAGNGVVINGTDTPNVYKSHIWFFGENITYTLDLNVGYIYDVTLGFAESYGPNCKNDTRVFSASVGNQLEENIDVFKSVGCKKPYDLVFKDIPGGSVDVVISRGSKENPFLSLIRAEVVLPGTATSTTAASMTDAPTSTPSLQPVSNVPVVMVHFGSFLPAEGYDAAQQSALLPLGEVMTFNGQGVVIDDTDTPTAYASHVYTFGTNITYKLQLEEGKMYDVMLGWSESYGPNCQNNARVFDARVGTRIHDDIDVYRAVGCRKPYNVTFQDIQGGNVEVVISRGPRENPFLSLIRVWEV